MILRVKKKQQNITTIKCGGKSERKICNKYWFNICKINGYAPDLLQAYQLISKELIECGINPQMLINCVGLAFLKDEDRISAIWLSNGQMIARSNSRIVRGYEKVDISLKVDRKRWRADYLESDKKDK